VPGGTPRVVPLRPPGQGRSNCVESCRAVLGRAEQGEGRTRGKGISTRRADRPSGVRITPQPRQCLNVGRCKHQGAVRRTVGKTHGPVPDRTTPPVAPRNTLCRVRTSAWAANNVEGSTTPWQLSRHSSRPRSAGPSVPSPEGRLSCSTVWRAGSSASSHTSRSQRGGPERSGTGRSPGSGCSPGPPGPRSGSCRPSRSRSGERAAGSGLPALSRTATPRRHAPRFPPPGPVRPGAWSPGSWPGRRGTPGPARPRSPASAR
jgi:hypothetical protein